MKEGFNTKNQCSKCNAMCRIEGWSECWDLCTCECHTKTEEKNISFNLPVMRSLPFPSKEEIKAEARQRWGEYFQMRDAFELGAEWMMQKLGNGNGA